MSTVGFIGGKFLPLHTGHVYAIMQGACRCDEFYVILSHNEERDRKICENSKCGYVDAKTRLRWLSALVKDMENVKVISLEDPYTTDESYNWNLEAERIREVIGKEVDYIFSSEHSYTKLFKECHPKAKHIVLDANREKYPISATKIRNEGVYKNWDYIPNVVKPYFVKKIMIVGTESCGKSTLVKYLGKLYNTTTVAEYGRTYCEELGGCDDILTTDDFKNIVWKHKLLEKDAIEKANKVCFIDTEAIVSQYYHKMYVGGENKTVDSVAEIEDYDLWLYLEPDVKWVDDGSRSNGDIEVREKLNRELKDMLDRRGIKYISINGNYIDRLNKAIKLVDNLIY